MKPLLLRFATCMLIASLLTACSSDKGAIFTEIPPPQPLPALQTDITVANGALLGTNPEDTNIVHFQGIPYAAPPIGGLRWKAPQAAANWEGIRDASAPGPACIQASPDSGGLQSEDCLYLNIAAPVAEVFEARPVMVWFHGGGDETGSGHEGIYDLVGLANATDNIVVSVNSRLGFLGFYSHPELRGEDANNSVGNYHHLDQIQALQWVQDNIAAFNGDPDNVTIFGESAGANGVCRHLSSRLSDGLYKRAILQSGTCGNTLLNDLDTANTQGEFFATVWGCDTEPSSILCARAKSAEELRQNLADAGKSGLLDGGLLDQEMFRPRAVIDAYVFTESPNTAVRGAPADVEVISGVNRNEITLFLSAPGSGNPDDNDTSYDAALAAAQTSLTAAQRADIINNFYPCSDYATCSDAFADFVGDVVFVCPSVLTSDALHDSGHAVRFYHFTHPINNGFLLPALVPTLDDNAPQLGVPHSAELFYLWNLPILQSGDSAEQTTTAMRQYWGSFAENGIPVADGQPDWPVYSGRGGDYLELGTRIEVRREFKAGKCEFIETLGIL